MFFNSLPGNKSKLPKVSYNQKKQNESSYIVRSIPDPRGEGYRNIQVLMPKPSVNGNLHAVVGILIITAVILSTSVYGAVTATQTAKGQIASGVNSSSYVHN